MEIFRLFGKIVVDNDEANREIDETVDKAEESKSKMSTAFKAVGTAVGTFLTADKIADFGNVCISAAADAEAASSQFTQVFEELEEEAANSLSAIADQAGTTQNRMKGSFTKIAAFAKTTGMDTVDALALSERAMIAVADSAAFYDRTLEETTESLQSFLKGNFENDAALGLSCTETTRNAAANKLYGKSFIELSEAQKQLTLLQMVEDANAASGALGQASRESDTWTNQTGNLKQAFTDFTAVIGSLFLPVAVKVVGFLADAVSWMTEHKTLITIVGVVIGTLTAALVAYNAVKAVKLAMEAAEITTLWSLVAAQTAALAPYLLIAAAIAALITVIVLCVKHWDTIKEAALKAWEGVCQVWQKAKEWFKEKVVDPIKEVFTGLWDFVSGIFDGLFGKKNKLSVEVEETKTTKVNGSHASGLNYVPFNGYIAELHKGEMVVPAAEAQRMRMGQLAYAGAAQPISIPITLELDGSVLARKTYSYNQTEIARHGKSFVR